MRATLLLGQSLSRKLKVFNILLNFGAKANYYANDREFLAIVFSLELWRPYLVSRQFTVLTDHALLVYLHS